jgi:heat shock protein HtpX
MDGVDIAIAVASLGALRRSSVATVVLVFGFLAFLLLLILVIVDLVLSSRAFPGALVLVVALGLLFMLLQWAVSPWIVRWAIRGRRVVTRQANPWLYDTVEELARQAAVPRPRIWTSEEPTPNAFVFGRTLASSELVVTEGLLQELNRDEIRAVLAHEVGHLRHRDVIVMTFASSVPLLAYLLARGGFEILRGSGRVRSRDKGAGQAILVAVLVAVLAYAVYLVTQLLVRHLSRTREYYADAYSAAATRDPHLLASALTKISFGLSLARRTADPSGLRAFYISDPVKAHADYRTLRDRMARYDIDRDGQIDSFELQKALEDERRNPWARANELFATHPPTYKRILMLEQMEEEIVRGGLPVNIYQYV